MNRIGLICTSLVLCLCCAESDAQNQCNKGNNSRARQGSSQSTFVSLTARPNGNEARGGQGQRGRQAQRGGQGQNGPQGQADGRRRQGGFGGPQGRPPVQGQDGQQRLGDAGPRQGQLDPAQRLLMMFKQVDRNGDGKISRQEARGPMKENFDRADQDSDGFVDREEQMAVIRKIKQMMAKRGGGDGAGENAGKLRPAGDRGDRAERERGEGKGKPGPRAERGGAGEFGDFGKTPPRERPAPDRRKEKDIFGDF